MHNNLARNEATAPMTPRRQSPHDGRATGKMRVLVVEDEHDISGLIKHTLERSGDAIVEIAASGDQALKLASEQPPDLIILDLNLPVLGGLEVCRLLRTRPGTAKTPIIMLTARATEGDRVIGLDAGADDYITKPFSPRELAARVRAVLRRTDRDSKESGPKGMTYKGIVLDQTNRRVEVNGKSISLTPTEFRLLAMFMREPGRVFTRAQLLDAIHGVAFEAYERAIDAHVKNLRRKIEPPGEPRYIQTVYGVGYRFAER